MTKPPKPAPKPRRRRRRVDRRERDEPTTEWLVQGLNDPHGLRELIYTIDPEELPMVSSPTTQPSNQLSLTIAGDPNRMRLVVSWTLPTSTALAIVDMVMEDARGHREKPKDPRLNA